MLIMPTFAYDAFVSYRDSDSPRVNSLVDALKRAGLRVYWDKMLRPGEVWAHVLEQAIVDSRFTLLCVSPAAVTSSFVEAELKKSDGKIIPLFLEKTDLPLLWEARIGRIQRAELSPSQFTLSDPGFVQLCEIVSGRAIVERLAGEESLEF